MRSAILAGAVLVAGVGLSLTADSAQPPLSRHVATRMSMACVYAIEAYGADAQALPRIVEEGFDEVDRIDRLMSHYKAESPLSRLNQQAATIPWSSIPELFDFIAESMRYSRESGGAFDITVGPLMKAWGFFRGEGRMPSVDELSTARRHVGASHVVLDPATRTIAFDEPGVELDLGGIAKGYAVDRVVRLLKAGRSRGPRQCRREHHIRPGCAPRPYGLGGRDRGPDEFDPGRADRPPQGPRAFPRWSSEKWFEAGGPTGFAHHGPAHRPAGKGVLSVAVPTNTGTAGDALDDAFFVLGPGGAGNQSNKTPSTEAFFFLPGQNHSWKMIQEAAR